MIFFVKPPSDDAKGLCRFDDEICRYKKSMGLDYLTPRDFHLGLSQKFKKICKIAKEKSIKNRIYKNKMMNYQIE
jgi:hypothetical protein